MSLPERPLRVAAAKTVTELPRGAGLAYEPKFDGHRMVVFVTGGRVVLQARSGRTVTAAFPDLAEAARRLPQGTVLDGEVVVWRDGRTDFAAVQRRAAATPGRAPALARALPASYAAFDLLAEDGEDLRPLAYARRRERLVALVAPLGPPIQPVPVTLDAAEAAEWFEALPAIGVEGLVIKRTDQPYRGGARAWRKLRHTSGRDAAVVGFSGPAARPVSLVLVLPDDDVPVVSSPLSPALQAQAAVAVAGREAAGGGTAPAVGLGEVAYRSLRPGLVAEVDTVTTRHTVATVRRLRLPEELDPPLNPSH
ncbi:ATP-dependent DNA ligase [Streptomyces sp. NPDC005805]|uniref:ATP-dependent DNA ligase n=1 Tax=Streptomyces sp. NPDC005805 TaxID=3157068 RepID=UPI0034052AF3